jgi:hypothetical protein
MRISIARLNLRAGTSLSAAFGLALTFASLPAAAQQWTPRPANPSWFRASVPMRGWKIAMYYDQMVKARPPIAVR